MTILQMALSLFGTVALLLTTERIMQAFFEERRAPFFVIALSYLFFLAAFNFQFWVGHTALNVPLITLALIALSLNYKSVVGHRLIAVAGSYFTLILITTLVSNFAYVLPADLFDASEHFAFVSAALLSYLITLIVFPRFISFRKVTIHLHKIWFPFYLIIIINAVSNVLFQLNVPFALMILDFAAPLAIVFLIFYLYNHLSKAIEDNVKSALHSQEKEYYFTQCQLMQESVESIKSIRHDMKFHLAMARDFTANNEADKATDYLNGLLGDIEKNEIYSNTKNIAFDSIINFKLNNTKQEDIKFDIRLLIPPSLNIEVADIVTIIGNLLDNALDAVSKVESKMIKLDIEYSRESLFIQIENTFDGVVEYATDESEDIKRIITRKSGGEHGLGLKNIQKSVEKYNGHIDISHDENIFSVGVLLYVDDK